MDDPPESSAQDPARSWPARIFLGLVGIAAAAGSFFPTVLLLWGFAMALDCAGPPTWATFFQEGVPFTTMFAVAASLSWLLAVSFLRLAAGRRWVRGRSWIATPLVVTALSLAAVGIAYSQQPPPSETCQPFEMS